MRTPAGVPFFAACSGYLSLVSPSFGEGGGKRSGRNGLIALRSLFASFVVALVHIAVVVFILYGVSKFSRHPIDGRWAAVGVALVGIYALLAPRLVERQRRLDCADDRTLARSYVTRFFLRLAFSESSAMVGFVGFILTSNPAVYLVGVAFAFVGFNRLAPTARHLAHDQQALYQAGCTRSLVHALASAPPPSTYR